jgi:hypothetical protein
MLLAEGGGGNSSSNRITPPKRTPPPLSLGNIASGHSSSSAVRDRSWEAPPKLSSSQRADRDRTAGRRSAINDRKRNAHLVQIGVPWNPYGGVKPDTVKTSSIVRSGAPRRPDQDRDRKRTAGPITVSTVRFPQESARIASIEADKRATRAEKAAKTSRIPSRFVREELRASAVELRQDAEQKRKAYLVQIGVPWNPYGGVKPDPVKPKTAKRQDNSPSPTDLYTGRALKNNPTLNLLGVVDNKAEQSQTRVDVFLNTLKRLSPQQRDSAIEAARARAIYIGDDSYAHALDAKLPKSRQIETLKEEQAKRDTKIALQGGGSLVLDFIPWVGTAKGAQEAVTGKDWVTGQNLSKWDRVISVVGAVGAVIPIPGVGALVKGTGRGIRAGVRAIKGVDDAARVVDSTKAVERIAKGGNEIPSSGKPITESGPKPKPLPSNKPSSETPPVSTPPPKPPSSTSSKPPSTTSPVSPRRAAKPPSTSTPKPPSRTSSISAPHTPKPLSSSTPKARPFGTSKPSSSAPSILGDRFILSGRRSTSTLGSSVDDRIAAEVANLPLPTITPLSQRTTGTNFVLDEFGRTLLVEGRVDGKHLGRAKERLQDPWQKPAYGIHQGDHNGHLLPESAVDDPARANISENLFSESPASNLGEKAKFDRLAVATKENNLNSEVWIIAEPFYKGMDKRPYAVRYFLEKDGKIVDSRGRVILNPSTHSKGMRKGMYWRN